MRRGTFRVFLHGLPASETLAWDAWPPWWALAPVVALAYVRSRIDRHLSALVWNMFGIADLVVAVGLGFLTSPSPFQMFAFAARNELVTAFPLVLVPSYLVPLSILLHVISLMKLRRAGSRTAAREAAVASALRPSHQRALTPRGSTASAELPLAPRCT
jgi:hypothetical protein